MGEYVEIGSGVADMISAANGLRAQGDALAEQMRTTGRNLSEMEQRQETFPPDDFTREFLKTYHATTQDSQGNSTTVNLAVRHSAVDMGTKLAEIGAFVAEAMVTYTGTDEANASGITAAPRT